MATEAITKYTREGLPRELLYVDDLVLITEKDRGTWPCGMCGKGVGNNSIQCTRCEKWVHGRCSGVKGRLVKQDGSFVCKRCKSRDRNQNGFSSNDQVGAIASRVVDVGNEMNLEKV